MTDHEKDELVLQLSIAASTSAEVMKHKIAAVRDMLGLSDEVAVAMAILCYESYERGRVDGVDTTVAAFREVMRNGA